jgi:hypothetical protein
MMKPEWKPGSKRGREKERKRERSLVTFFLSGSLAL